jgi:hypothetical protein
MNPLADTEAAKNPAGHEADDWKVKSVIFLSIWLTLMIAGRNGRYFNDADTFWHIAVGQRVLSSGVLIYTDPFSFTFEGKPWMSQSWLVECGVALLHRMSGFDGILLAVVTLLAGLYTWVAHRLIRAGLHSLLAVFLMAVTIMASSYHFHARPLLLTIVLLGWTFAQLSDFEAGRIPLRRLFWLVPIFVLWANVHGGMVGGLGTLGLTVAGWTIAYWFRWGGPLVRSQQILWLSLLVVCCGLAAFVNPYGTDLLRVWFSLIQSPVIPRYIHECLPLLHSGTGIAVVVLLLGFVYMAALLGVLPSRPRVTWLIPLVWLGLTWTRVRHGPLFAITAVIALADIFPHVRWAKWLADKGSVVFRLRTPDGTEVLKGLDWRSMLIPSVVVLTTLVFHSMHYSFPLLGRDWARLDHVHWPVDLLPELRKLEGSATARKPIFNDMEFGGFLMYHTPGFRVFIDGRCELYGDEGLMDYVHALHDDPSQIEHWADQYGFDTALLRPDSAFDLYLQNASGWSMTHRTESAVLYRRTVKIALRD